MAIRNAKLGGTDVADSETNFKSDDYNDTNDAMFDKIDNDIEDAKNELSKVIFSGLYDETTSISIPSGYHRIKLIGTTTVDEHFDFTIAGKTGESDYAYFYSVLRTGSSVTINQDSTYNRFFVYADLGQFSVELSIGADGYVYMTGTSFDTVGDYIYSYLCKTNVTVTDFGTLDIISLTTEGALKVIAYKD